MKTCLTSDCQNITEGSTDFCSSCNRRHRKIASERKKEAEKRELLNAKSKPWYPKPKKVSDKRKELNKEYFKLVEQFKKDNPECKGKCNEYCTKNTNDPHHKRGRGKYLLDVTTWLPVCRNCHDYIGQHTAEAYDKGWSESRLATENKTI